MTIDLGPEGLDFTFLPNSGTGETRGYTMFGQKSTAYLSRKPSSRLNSSAQSRSTLSDELHGAGALEDAVIGPLGLAGRGLICRCYAGRYLGATVRKSKKNAGATGTAAAPDSDWDLSPYRAPSAPGPYLFSGRSVCLMLAHLIGAQASLSQLPGGVVVVAGGTGSGKSTVVRGIAWHLVQSRIRQYVAESQSDFTKRMDRPHFLTVENPIEEYLIHGAASNPAIVQKKYGIDYTPRQIPHDTPTLRQALMLDALRQTPFLTYVGEMRSTEDMRTVLDFAETGHAVITTMHAGSVREAIERLLASGGARTAADKGQIARRIRAIVHLEPLIVNDPNLKEKKVVVPAIWRNTPAGVAALVADGLSSVLPSRHEIYSGSAAFSFGRASFVEALATHGDLVRAGIRHDRIQTVRAVLIQAAMERDLNVSRDCTE